MNISKINKAVATNNNSINENKLCRLGKKSENDLSLDGDIVLSDPPSASDMMRFGDTCNKSRSDMSLNEYKQYFCNKLVNMPVNVCVREKVSGQVKITEDAFKRMKEDPEYEQKVLNIMKQGYTCQIPAFAPKCAGYQVIGKDENETYGIGYNPNDSTDPKIRYKNKESYWDKKRKKDKGRLKEQKEYDLKIERENSLLRNSQMYKNQIESKDELSNMLNDLKNFK